MGSFQTVPLTAQNQLLCFLCFVYLPVVSFSSLLTLIQKPLHKFSSTPTAKQIAKVEPDEDTIIKKKNYFLSTEASIDPLGFFLFVLFFGQFVNENFQKLGLLESRFD